LNIINFNLSYIAKVTAKELCLSRAATIGCVCAYVHARTAAVAMTTL